MTSLRAFRRMSGLPDSIRRWSQAAEHVKAGQQALTDAALRSKRSLESKPMDVSKWPVSNVTLGHFPKARSDVVLLGLCDMPVDTPVVNRYDQDGRKLPDPRGPALLMTMFQLWAIYHDQKVAETVGGLHEGMSRGGFSQRDLTPLWKLLDKNDVVTVRVVAWPRFANIVKDGEAELFGPDRGHWPGKKVFSSRYRLSLERRWRTSNRWGSGTQTD